VCYTTQIHVGSNVNAELPSFSMFLRVNALNFHIGRADPQSLAERSAQNASELGVSEEHKHSPAETSNVEYNFSQYKQKSAT
jgi:hypothetical protein